MSALTPYYTNNFVHGDEIYFNSNQISSYAPMPNLPTPAILVSTTLDEKTNELFRKAIPFDESKLDKHLDRYALRQLRNETVLALDQSFKRAHKNLVANESDGHEFVTESNEQIHYPKRRKLNTDNQPEVFVLDREKNKNNVTKFIQKLSSFFPKENLEKEEIFFSSLSLDDQDTILNWIERFRFCHDPFLIRLLFFVIMYPGNIATCKSILDTPDYFFKDGLDCSNTREGKLDRINSVLYFMNNYHVDKVNNSHRCR